MLKTCKKDVHNPHFICPENILEAHDIYHKKVLVIEERRRREADIIRKEREALRAVRENEKFIKEKSRFFGLTISDGEIDVMVLDSVEAFIEEGSVQHICVGTQMYYTKKDSLILSARIEGKRIETVEVSLDSLSVIQYHGAYNKNTEYHNRIVELVNSNAHLIKARMIA